MVELWLKAGNYVDVEVCCLNTETRFYLTVFLFM